MNGPRGLLRSLMLRMSPRPFIGPVPKKASSCDTSATVALRRRTAFDCRSKSRRSPTLELRPSTSSIVTEPGASALRLSTRSPNGRRALFWRLLFALKCKKLVGHHTSVRDARNDSCGNAGNSRGPTRRCGTGRTGRAHRGRIRGWDCPPRPAGGNRRNFRLPGGCRSGCGG